MQRVLVGFGSLTHSLCESRHHGTTKCSPQSYLPFRMAWAWRATNFRTCLPYSVGCCPVPLHRGHGPSIGPNDPEPPHLRHVASSCGRLNSSVALFLPSSIRPPPSLISRSNRLPESPDYSRRPRSLAHHSLLRSSRRMTPFSRRILSPHYFHDLPVRVPVRPAPHNFSNSSKFRNTLRIWSLPLSCASTIRLANCGGISHASTAPFLS